MPEPDSARLPYKPDYAVPPGETLQETLEALGMTQAQLAVRTGLTPKTINQIVKGGHALSLETAIKLERATGVPAHVWNALEMSYRERLARVADRQSLEADLDWLEGIPTGELIKRGVIQPAKNKVELLDSVLAFFGVSGSAEWENLWIERLAASFRKSSHVPMEPGPTATWLRLGELRAMKIECQPYDMDRFVEALRRLRAQTVEPPEVFQDNLTDWCAAAGVAVALIPELRGCPAYGVTRWLAPTKGMIQLSLRYKSDDQFWFSFFHEAWHVLHGAKRDMAVHYGADEDEEDERANRFAADVLIPAEHAGVLPLLRSKAAVAQFATRIGIAPGIVVGRLQREGLVRYKDMNGLKRRFVWKSG